jgi:hypothetical protein
MLRYVKDWEVQICEPVGLADPSLYARILNVDLHRFAFLS